jgi:hypothetical protein
MTYAQALVELHSGKKIRRRAWFKGLIALMEDGSYRLKNEMINRSIPAELHPEDIAAEDWEIVT